MNEKTLEEYNAAEVKVSFWLDASGEIGFFFEAKSPGGATPEHLARVRTGMLKFSDKLQELIMRQKELAPKPEQPRKYCYGFYPDPELFYDWETLQDLLFDGRLHGFDNNEEKVRAVLSQMMELSDIRPTFFSVEKEETVTVSVGNRDEGHIK